MTSALELEASGEVRRRQRIAKLEHSPHFDEGGGAEAAVEVVGDGHGARLFAGNGNSVIQRGFDALDGNALPQTRRSTPLTQIRQ